jgi:hypothetical protein
LDDEAERQLADNLAYGSVRLTAAQLGRVSGMSIASADGARSNSVTLRRSYRSLKEQAVEELRRSVDCVASLLGGVSPQALAHLQSTVTATIADLEDRPEEAFDSPVPVSARVDRVAGEPERMVLSVAWLESGFRVNGLFFRDSAGVTNDFDIVAWDAAERAEARFLRAKVYEIVPDDERSDETPATRSRWPVLRLPESVYSQLGNLSVGLITRDGERTDTIECPVIELAH